MRGPATATHQEKDKNVNTAEREKRDCHLQMTCPPTPKSQSLVFKILGHSLSSGGFQIYDQQIKFIAFVCISHEHRVTELTDACLVNLTQSRVIWEEGSLTEKIPPSDRAVGKPMRHLQDCHPWASSPELYTKAN